MYRVRFQSTCPACRNDRICNWQHYGCGGHFFLTNQARLICKLDLFAKMAMPMISFLE